MSGKCSLSLLNSKYLKTHQFPSRPRYARLDVRTHSGRREAILALLSLGSIFPSDILNEVAPLTGDCPTCELRAFQEVVQGSKIALTVKVDPLGSRCSGVASCLSSYDDRPGHFLAPWEYDTRNPTLAMERLVKAVRQEGAVKVEQRGNSYLYAMFAPPSDQGLLGALSLLQGTDDVEFLIPDDNDVRVEIRSSSRLQTLPDGGRQEQRLERIRAALGWEQVPIIRNRKRALFIVESPFDTFGPTPPVQEYGGLRFEDGEGA